MKLKLIALCTLLLAVLILGASAAPAKSHEMGSLCEGSDQNTCRVSVQAIRESENQPNHPAILMGSKTQDSLYLYSDVAFTVEVLSDDGGPYPFYPPISKKAGKRFSSGPAKPEANGRTYHLVVHSDVGAADPHIVISPCAGHANSTC